VPGFDARVVRIEFAAVNMSAKPATLEARMPSYTQILISGISASSF
jgi:hypothetical protein